MKDTGFYFVWDDGGEAPRAKHCDFATAATEAKRLARRNQGRRFVVLRSVIAFEVNDIQSIDLSVDDDDILPF